MLSHLLLSGGTAYQKLHRSDKGSTLSSLSPTSCATFNKLHYEDLNITVYTNVMPSATESAYHRCLDCNKKWAAEVSSKDPDFFPRCSKGQAPPVLWIGCADSRVPETTILNCQPGEVFVHRNIANIVNNTDISLLSIVQFAVFHLKVKHIVVAGHTSCGGVGASLANAKLDILDIWLQPLRALREEYHDELEAMEEKERATFLAKKNVQAGVQALKRIPTVIDAMRERGLDVHGVVYKLDTGLLEEVDADEDEKKSVKRVKVFERR